MPTGTQSRKQREVDFLERAKSIHGNKFDYSKFVYVTAKIKSIIICSVHGEFEQNPDKHLTGKYACMQCWSEVNTSNKPPVMLGPKREPRMSLQTYLSRLNLPKGLTVEIVEYKTLQTGVVILHCDKHGPQKSKATRVLYSEHKCHQCSWAYRASLQYKGYDDFLLKAKEVHGDAYTYPDASVYVDRKSILTINCVLHGDFQKKAQKHLAGQGQGCHRCRLDNLIATGQLTGGYDERLFAADREIAESPATIYYLKVGDHWKIGITRNRLGNRLASIKNKAKAEVETLDTFNCTLEEAYELEQLILADFAKVRVYGLWSTELFCVDVLEGFSLEEYYESLLRTKELTS